MSAAYEHTEAKWFAADAIALPDLALAAYRCLMARALRGGSAVQDAASEA
jgi:hypothetical protein